MTGGTATRADAAPTPPGRPHRTVRPPVLLVVAVPVVVVIALASLSIGARTLPLGTVWQALVAFDGSPDHLLVRDIRVPRALLAVVVGAALAVSGALIRTVTRNPLAEPGILGVTSGAGFAIAVGTAAGIAGSAPGQLLTAVLGAALAAVAVYLVGGSSPLRLLLAGVALGAVLGGLSLGLRLLLPTTFDAYRFWSVGTLAGREQADAGVAVVTVVVALAASALVVRTLETLALGDDVATALGVPVRRARLVVLALITVLAGGATAIAGPILFVGLIVPQLLRRVTGSSLGWLLGLSTVLGAGIVLAADVAARVVLPTGELPVAVMTSVIGAPFLIHAVRREPGDGA